METETMMEKLKRWSMEDEVKRLAEMEEVHDRLCANHAMYLRSGDYENDRFADKSITADSMAAKILEYAKKIKRQKIKIEKMEMEMEKK